MPVQEIPRPREYIAPNALHDRMRRRISRVGLLVAALSVLLTTLLLFLIGVWASLR